VTSRTLAVLGGGGPPAVAWRPPNPARGNAVRVGERSRSRPRGRSRSPRIRRVIPAPVVTAEPAASRVSRASTPRSPGRRTSPGAERTEEARSSAADSVSTSPTSPLGTLEPCRSRTSSHRARGRRDSGFEVPGSRPSASASARSPRARRRRGGAMPGDCRPHNEVGPEHGSGRFPPALAARYPNCIAARGVPLTEVP